MRIHAGLVEVDAHTALFLFPMGLLVVVFFLSVRLVVVLFLVVVGVPAGKAVLRLEALDGNAHLHPVPNPIEAS